MLYVFSYNKKLYQLRNEFLGRGSQKNKQGRFLQNVVQPVTRTVELMHAFIYLF